MARDERFPGYKAMKKVSPKFGTPLVATVVVGVLLEIVLAAFATRTNFLEDLFGAATLMPAVIYFVTVVLYVATKHKLPGEHGFNTWYWEVPIIVVSIVWLIFELLIFRAGFSTDWVYVAVIVAIGLLYFGYMVASPTGLWR